VTFQLWAHKQQTFSRGLKWAGLRNTVTLRNSIMYSTIENDMLELQTAKAEKANSLLVVQCDTFCHLFVHLIVGLLPNILK